MGNREELQRRGAVRVQKNSEALLKTKVAERTEDRSQDSVREKNDAQKPMTGFEPVAQKAAPDEVMRLESSYGNIAFGGDAASGLSVVISEKRRHNSITVSDKMKRLHESRERTRKLGRGRFAFNDERGATVFRYDSNATKNEILAGIRAQVTRQSSATIGQMMPFLSSRDGRTARDGEELLLAHRERMFEQRLTQALAAVRSTPEKKQYDDIFAPDGLTVASILDDGAEDETDETDETEDLDDIWPG